MVASHEPRSEPGTLDRRRFGTLSLSALGAALLAGCTTSANTKQSAASEATTLTVVQPDPAISWAIDHAFGGLEAPQQLQATLLRKPYVKSSVSDSGQEDTSTFDGYLAERYDVSADGLTYTFHLRDAVSAAGNHLTADDVLWSFERKFKTPTSVVAGVMAPQITKTEQFRKVDDHTVTLTLPDASYGATTLALLSDLCGYVYDSTLLKKNVSAQDPYAVVWSSTNPDHGFGPYQVASYQQGVQLVLKARTDFILGKPPVDTIVFKVISDAGNRANAVRNGDADLAEAVAPADLAALAKVPTVRVAKVDSPNAFLQLPLVTNKKPFDDVRVRQAMAWAVPYQQIVDSVYRGFAVRNGPGFLLNTAKGYDGSGLTPYAYDPVKARALLAQAGHPDGVSFDLAVSAGAPDAREAATLIQTYAAKAGFTIRINQLPTAAFSQGRSTHTFQAFLLTDFAITLTPGYELNVYTGKGSSNNFADWEYPPFYAAVAAGNAAGDPFSAAAGKKWNAAERIYVDQAPIVFIAQIQPSIAMASRVAGYAWRSDNIIDFAAISTTKT